MNKSDYNSNFKTKVSRSLTDLQNSLDEACRLGLPPGLVEQFQDLNDSYGGERMSYNFRNDLTYKSASNNLERLISSHERQINENRFHQKEEVNAEQMNNNSLMGSRQMYLDTLRMLATNQPQMGMHRSRSSELLGINTENFHRTRRESARPAARGAVESDSEREDPIDRRVDQELRWSPATAGEGEACRSATEERLLERLSPRHKWQQRESDLLDQLKDAINTIEEAKFEEMQALLRAEQTKEELDNMKKRFSDLVEENQRKLANQSVLEDRFLQESIRKLKEELDMVKQEAALKIQSTRSVEEQLRSSRLEIERLEGVIATMQSEKLRLNEDLNISVTKAVLQRDETMATNDRLCSTLDRERANHAQEKSILQEEIGELRARIGVTETAQLRLSQDKVSLLEELGCARAQVEQLQQAARAEKAAWRGEMESAARRQEKRTRSLQEELARKQELFETMMGEAEAVMRQQVALIGRLKHELGSSVHGLDGFADRHREEVGSLQLRLEQRSEELNAVKLANRDLMQTVEEFESTLETMRMSYRGLEEKRDKQDKEIIEHLSRQNELMKVIELLTNQLQDMRRRFSDCTCGAFDPGDDFSTTRLLDKVLMGADGCFQ